MENLGLLEETLIIIIIITVTDHLRGLGLDISHSFVALDIAVASVSLGSHWLEWFTTLKHKISHKYCSFQTLS